MVSMKSQYFGPFPTLNCYAMHRISILVLQSCVFVWKCKRNKQTMREYTWQWSNIAFTFPNGTKLQRIFIEPVNFLLFFCCHRRRHVQLRPTRDWEIGFISTSIYLVLLSIYRWNGVYNWPLFCLYSTDQIANANRTLVNGALNARCHLTSKSICQRWAHIHTKDKGIFYTLSFVEYKFMRKLETVRDNIKKNTEGMDGTTKPKAKFKMNWNFGKSIA